MEFQVLLMAGGSGQRLSPLVDSTIPYFMLNIANKPMIYYSLNWLESNGVKKLIIVVQKQQSKILSKYMKEHYVGKMEFDVETCEDDVTSAQAIRALDKVIQTDFIVVGVDFITNCPLLKLVDLHRRYNPIASIVLSRYQKDASDKLVVEHIIGYDPDDPRPIVKYITAKSDLNFALKLKPSYMIKIPDLMVTTLLCNCYCYIFSKSVVDLLEEKDYTSLTHQLIPFLVKNYKVDKPFLSTSQIYDYQMGYKPFTKPKDVFYFQAGDYYMKRCYTMGNFLKINRDLAKGDLSLIDAITGQSVTVATTTLHSSSISLTSSVANATTLLGNNSNSVMPSQQQQHPSMISNGISSYTTLNATGRSGSINTPSSSLSDSSTLLSSSITASADLHNTDFKNPNSSDVVNTVGDNLSIINAFSQKIIPSNTNVSSISNPQIGNDCILGLQVTMEENATVEQTSVIGNHCKSLYLQQLN